MRHRSPKPRPEVEVPDTAYENLEQEATIVEPPAPASAHPKKPSKLHLTRKKLTLVIAVVVLIAAGGGAYAYHQHQAKPSTVTTSSAKPLVKVIKGNQFLSVPKKLTDLAFFKPDQTDLGTICNSASVCTSGLAPGDVSYYQIGTTATNQPIVVAYDNQQDIESFQYVAIETTPGHFSILGKLDYSLNYAIDKIQKGSISDQQTLDNFSQALSTNVVLDTATTIPELTFPAKVTAGGQAIKTSFTPDITDSPTGYILLNGLSDIRGLPSSSSTKPVSTTKIGSADGKTFYSVLLQDNTNYQVKEIYGTLNQVYASRYVPDDPLIVNDGATPITWADASKNTYQYFSANQGCGSPNGYVIAKNINKNQLTFAGTGPNGTKLYTMPTDAALFSEIYTDDYGTGAWIQDTSLQNLTASQFQDQHGVFLAQNSLGEYVLYERSDLIERGGCGKPVVYLYPQVVTSVNVSVGATVNKSDPLYTDGGWKNVLAQPDGQLTYQGKSYNSLFWEGTGHGVYPDITQGFVVAQKNLVATVRTQLTQQGLNAKEVNDFMDFWQPRLPATPYVRISWLSTAQLNELAPLSITPKPDTLIRVFLDAQGLNKPIAIPPENLSALPRIGFTAVEWGGLLRGQ